MKVLHILPNERTADILRQAGVPEESIYAFPVLLAETDRYLWEYYVPNEIEKYDKVIVWHGNDANSLLLLALFSTLHVPLWHIDACKHKHLLRKKKVIFRTTKFINMITMSDMGIRTLFGKETKVRWWQILWNKRRWNYSLKLPDELIQHDKKGVYYFGQDCIKALCLWHTDDEYQPMTVVISNMMTHLELYDEYVSEGYIVQCMRQMAEVGDIDIRPSKSKIKEKFGQLTDVNYEIKRLNNNPIEFV